MLKLEILLQTGILINEKVKAILHSNSVAKRKSTSMTHLKKKNKVADFKTKNNENSM